MHTAVLALGIMLIISEVGAIGFMLLNTVKRETAPKEVVYLVPEKSKSNHNLPKVIVQEGKTIKTITMEQLKAEQEGVKKRSIRSSKSKDGYFSLVP